MYQMHHARASGVGQSAALRLSVTCRAFVALVEQSEGDLECFLHQLGILLP